MSKTVEDLRDLSSTRHQIRYFQKHFQSINSMQKMKNALMNNVQSLNQNNQTSRASQWLFSLKIKHQVLFLTTILIMIVTAMFIAMNHIQMKIFTYLLSNGFDQMLYQSNANFQASVMIKYMSVTQAFFEIDQYSLTAISQIYSYGLKSEYSIDLGVECPKYGDPSYLKIDQFCYVPHGSNDLQTFDNSTLNTEFVKLTNILNQFILCFGFQQSFAVKSVLQINLDNQEQMSSYYPQSTPFTGYLPQSRPFFIYQKQQYEMNITRRFYLSNYLKFYTKSGATHYGQTLTLSLLNHTEFQGIIAVSINFNVFNQVLQNFPDINLALVANDGTLLFEQNQFRKYDDQQFIYNQSQTGYNYLDWVRLQSHNISTQQIFINNTLFSEPIKVNIKRFKELPYYFIVYNNFTYENQIKTLQGDIINKLNIRFIRALFLFMMIFILIIIAVYSIIQQILKPFPIIQQIISYNANFQLSKQLRSSKLSNTSIEQIMDSNNILDILQFVIVLKYSEFQNIGLIKTKMCKNIENFKLPQNHSKNTMIIQQQLGSIADDIGIQKIEKFRSAQFVGYGFISLDQIIEQDYSQTSLKCIQL